jgi:alpha-tubulin suppressor-like RCC1 family protein
VCHQACGSFSDQTTSPRFVAISAGSDHLLALTSSGRTFAYPISKLANSHGQLGFRKFDIPVRSSEAASTASPSRLPVEMIPQAIIDPYARSSSLNRPATSSSSSSDILRLLDDQDIRFSDTLFEIPGLKGIKITQVVAGGRTSFVKTDTGKVLGWGANENA